MQAAHVPHVIAATIAGIENEVPQALADWTAAIDAGFGPQLPVVEADLVV